MVYAMFSIGILGFLVWAHHMFSVGLDVDKFVSTELHLSIYSLGEWEKILLYAGNSSISSPLAFIALGKIYLITPPGQSAGNFKFSTKATAVTKNTYNSYHNLPLSNCSLLNPYFVTGFTDGEGCFIVRVRKNSASKLGWYVEPIFSIGLHKKDILVLEQIKSWFWSWALITALSAFGGREVPYVS